MRMLPRGLKAALKQGAPCRLVGSGKRKRFEATASRTALRGLTKRLQARVFSNGTFPLVAIESTVRPSGGHWRGKGGGRRRGRAVDAQVTRLAAMSEARRGASKMLVLTRMLFAALAEEGLEPVMGQRAVCSTRHRVGTAADIVCYSAETKALVVVELKCGHTGSKVAAAVRDGKPCTMATPLRRVSDCYLHRHMAQLAVTHHLLMREARTLQKLKRAGVQTVDAVLMYASDDGVDVYRLDDWWTRKAEALLDRLA